MTKIISFSLWGSNQKYTIGAIRNSELQKTFFPDWTCRYYIDEHSVPKEIVDQLISNGCQVIKCGHGNWGSMFWRFYAAEDSDIMLSRDCDSRLSEREVIAVNEWLESDKDFHIVIDHPWHNVKILGGLWGVRNNLLKNIRHLISKWKIVNRLQTDQEFLTAIVYPIIKDNAFVHDEFFSNGHKIKHVRIDGEHLGGAFDHNDKPVEEHRNILRSISP